MASAIGIDIGGTFIDIVVADENGLRHAKVPSIPGQPAQGVLAGLRCLVEEGDVVPSDVGRAIHGSTVATNALLEASWGRTALVTTRGFRDVLEIGRQNRPRLYDLSYRRSEMVVPRDLRFEITERVDSAGRELVAVDRAELESLAGRLRREGVAAVAVVFLFSFLNPDHEREVGRVLSEALPVPVVLSSDVLPEFREYERTSTTVVTAALRPVVGAYVSELQDGAAEMGLPKAWQIMQSSGAVTSAETAEEEPARVLLSGPAGGVEGARAVGETVGATDLITMDMGGTSCDVALIRGGRIGWSTSSHVGGHPVALPMVEIHTIGAGGGSIAWIDPGGALRVGPRSAGADPGPACYGRGGERPTVTDAHLLLGHLDPERPIGGLRTLDREAAGRAVRDLAGRLGLTELQTALGILEVSDAAMERAIRVISVERGHDPREFSLLAFGGAGPLHAVRVARRLSIPRVIVPSTAGVLSAFGLLTAEAGHDNGRSLVRLLKEVSADEFSSVVAELRSAGERRLLQEGIEASRIGHRVSADLRYAGQSHELNIGLPDGECVDDEGIDALSVAFHDEHASCYGHSAPDEPIELVTVRVRSSASPELVMPEAVRVPRGEERFADVWFDEKGPTRTPFVGRASLCTGDRLVGPTIVLGEESTVVVPEGAHGSVDRHGHLLLEVGGP